MPSIYVIVLAWNNLNDTLECLASLQHLDYPDYEIVLVDNGSTDNTANTVRPQFPRAHVIENARNLGYAEGNNVGIRYALARGADYVWILNNDVVVAAEALARLVEVAEVQSDAGILSPAVYWQSRPDVIWFAGARWIAERANFQPIESGKVDNGQLGLEPYDTEYANGCAMLIKAEAARKVGLFDPRFFLLWEEVDLCYRARRNGYRVMVVPRAGVRHKVSRSFESSPAGSYLYYYTRNRLLWIERNLPGKTRVQALLRVLREMYWLGLQTIKYNTPPGERTSAKYQFMGFFDYVCRRFGPITDSAMRSRSHQHVGTSA